MSVCIHYYAGLYISRIKSCILSVPPSVCIWPVPNIYSK